MSGDRTDEIFVDVADLPDRICSNKRSMILQKYYLRIILEFFAVKHDLRFEAFEKCVTGIGVRYVQHFFAKKLAGQGP